MRTAYAILITSLLAPALSAQTGGWTFTDDLESGSLDHGGWTRGGRDLSGTGIVDVVSRNGSLAGHVFHRSFTETYLSKSFEVTPAFSLDFDMEVRAADPGTPGGAYYAMAGAYVELIGPSEYGRLEVMYCTSSYRPSLYNPDPRVEVLQITPNVNQHHSFTMADLYSYLPGVDMSGITAVRLTFNSYCSWWNSSASGDVWFDDVVARNLAATLEVNPDPPVAGGMATVTVTGFEPSRPALLFVSTQGPGSTLLPSLRLSLNIAAARPCVRTIQVPPATGSWPVGVPLAALGQTWWLQAAQQERSTRVLELTVQ